MEPHPLLIDIIIDKILGYLLSSSQQLCKARLVCVQWNKAATQILVRQHMQRFGGICGHAISKLKNYINFINSVPANSLTTLTFTKFVFHAEMFREHREADLVNLMSFLQLCGSNLDTLVIHNDFFSNVVYCENLLRKIALPNLKTFAFYDRRCTRNSSDACNQNFLFALIASSSHSLRSLTISFSRSTTNERELNTQNLVRLLKAYDFPQLNCLRLNVFINDDLLNTMSKKSMTSLHKLELTIDLPTFDGHSFKKFLTSLQQSLRVFVIKDLFRETTPILIDIPTMESLETLEIGGADQLSTRQPFSNFSYDLVPNLKKLLLRTKAPEVCCKVFFNNENLNAGVMSHKFMIKELCLPVNFYSATSMHRIVRAFSKLTKLEMHFSRAHFKTLQVVFREIRHLEELKLSQSGYCDAGLACVDDILTGLSRAQCNRILKERIFSETMSFIELQAKPGLMDLKNLRKFHMIHLENQNYVTDVTGYLVFLRMPKLIHLAVQSSKISLECLERLAKMYPDEMEKEYMIRNESRVTIV